MVPQKTLWMEIWVYMVVTKRGRDGAASSTAIVVPVNEHGIVLHEVPLGDNPPLVEALNHTRWTDARLRVPASFFHRDEATRRALLEVAVLRGQKVYRKTAPDTSSA